ncbi:hypothetical protein WI88_33120 [Burkholderia ubonensis]|nr:hypothetical protein WI88_33120 [Burkholderia ubonensis]
MKKPDYTSINAELERIFALDGATKFDAALRTSAAGEVFGQALFRGLHTFARNGEERRLWAALTKIETVTLAHVITHMRKRMVPEPDREVFKREGYRVAALFEGTSLATYFEWLEPEAVKAVRFFESMLDMSADPDDQELVRLLIKHEEAVVNCCDSVLSNGSITDACVALESDFAINNR